MTPKTAKHALLNIVAGGSSSLIIDGEEFPWDIAAEDIVVTQMQGLSLVRVSILVESTTVAANLSSMPEQASWGRPGDFIILREGTSDPPDTVNVFRTDDNMRLNHLVRTGKGLNTWTWSDSDQPGPVEGALSWDEVVRTWPGDKLTVVR